MLNRLVRCGSNFVILWWLTVLIASAQNLSDKVVTDAASALINDKVADGLSIGYVEGDHWGTVHLGTSNAKGKVADNLTVYELGSISKVFTSLLLADAVVRGEIKLDDVVKVENAAGIRLPSYQGRKIEWIDLSTHRSGLPRLPANLDASSLSNPYRLYDSKQAAAALKVLQLARKPGESQEYSNLGASVLGYLIAENAKANYQDLLQQRIATPLGMKDCTVDLTADQQKRFATPHDRVGSPVSRWTFADLPGAGGMSATMFDMMRFAKALLKPTSGKLGEAIELAWKQHRDADTSGAAMGLGWMIAGDGETRWHNGQTGGSHSALFINRRLNTAIVVLCNTAVMTEVDQLASQLLIKASGQTAPLKISEQRDKKIADKDGNDKSIDAKHRARLVGRYQLAANFIFDVQDRDGHLMVGITNQPTQEVFPDSATRWSYRGVDATLEFILNTSGPAKQLVLHQNGIKQTAKRLGN